MSKFAAQGIRIDVPDGWEAVDRTPPEAVDDGSRPAPTLHVSSVLIPEEIASFGGPVAERMTSDDTFMTLIDYGPELAGTPLFASEGLPTLDASMFHRETVLGGLEHQTACQHFFTYEGRAFCLYVILGSHIDRADLIPKVNSMIQTLELE